MKHPVHFVALAAILCSAPLSARDAGEPGVTAGAPDETVYDGDYLSIGLGVGYGPSYTGSDDFVAYPLPVVQGSFSGIGISPRSTGLAIDFLPDGEGNTNFSLGIAGRLNRDRVKRIKDPVVRAAGKLDTAVEIGPSAGIGFTGLLNPYDGLTISADALWDIAGAHGGMSVSPGISYYTPVSRGVAVSLSLGSKYIDEDYADYYYSVTPAQSLASGLPVFDADGGMESVGANLLAGIDLDGELANGGFSIVVIGGYSRLMGDARRTPFTAIRGDANQWFVGAGIGYTF